MSEKQAECQSLDVGGVLLALPLYIVEKRSSATIW